MQRVRPARVNIEPAFQEITLLAAGGSLAQKTKGNHSGSCKTICQLKNANVAFEVAPVMSRPGSEQCGRLSVATGRTLQQWR